MAYRKPPEGSTRSMIADLLSDAASPHGVPVAEFVARMQMAKLEDERVARVEARARRLERKRRRLVGVAAAYLVASVLSLFSGIAENAPVTAGIAGTSSLAGSAFAVLQISRIGRTGSNVRAPARGGVFSLFGWRGARGTGHGRIEDGEDG